MLRRTLLACLIVSTSGCGSPKAPEPAKPQTEQPKVPPTGQIVEPDWVIVSKNSSNQLLYVNANSIYPYKDGSFTMAEVAFDANNDKTKQIGHVFAFNCKSRLFSVIDKDGAISEPAPVVTWNVHTDIFNFVCFRVLRPDHAQDRHLKMLDVQPPQP